MDSPVSVTLLPSVGVTETCWMLNFYLGVGYPNEGPHACVIGILSVPLSSPNLGKSQKILIEPINLL